MINRLKKLEVANFRFFRHYQEIPFDADIVLIYGPNGTGKTSIINALELAITRSVNDLKIFADDYPRCLRNINTVEDAMTSLTWQCNDGDIYQNTIHINRDLEISESDMIGSKRDRLFFLDRCYLSQLRLSRLIEAYQEIEAENQEQPLISIMRELLGLDSLENLTSGLHEVGDIRRLEKAAPLYKQLRQDMQKLPIEMEQLEEITRNKRKEADEKIKVIHESIVQNGDPLPNVPWTLSGIRERMKALETNLLKELKANPLQKIQQLQGRFERAKEFTKATEGQRDKEAINSLTQKLESLKQKETETKAKIHLLLQKSLEEINSLGLTVINNFSKQDIGQQYDKIKTHITKQNDHLINKIKATSSIEKDLIILEQKQKTLLQTKQNMPAASTEILEQNRRWAETLGSILNFLSDNQCPICDRDYTETHDGSLKDHITNKLTKIGIDMIELEKTLKHRSQLEVDLQTVNFQIESIKKQRIQDITSLKIYREQQQSLKTIIDKISSLHIDREELEKLSLEKKMVSMEIEGIKIKLRQYEEGTKEIANIAEARGIKGEKYSFDELSNLITKNLNDQFETVHHQTKNRNHLLNIIREGEIIFREFEEAQAQYKKIDTQLSKIINASRDIDQAIDKARRLSRAATTVKATLMNRVFNQTLNALWVDIFEQLVDHETFKPRLSEPTPRRGQIRASIQGISDGASPFEQIASVVSSGNLNTAALTLFLSLHLIEEPKHRLIVLDDPVQNMDDVHVMNLASLFGKLAYEANRQLVITTHERALFEYLCLTLNPTRINDSLITIELLLDDKYGSKIISKVHSCQPDRLELNVC